MEFENLGMVSCPSSIPRKGKAITPMAEGAKPTCLFHESMELA